jgi:DNA-binding Xre family transcriptional regulator
MKTMLTNELRETYGKLPGDVKSAMLALSVLIDRIGTLPKTDRDELFELLQEWRKADAPEDQESIRRAMEEILAQVPITVKPMPLVPKPTLTRGLQAWAEHVGKTIRAFRESQNLTQTELADRAGLPQSHISRLENAEHSATHLTLEKIAKALGVEIGKIDPCLD